MSLSSISEERGSLRLKKSRLYTLYVVSIGLFLTGVLWLIFHYFMRTENDFGFKNHPLEIWWLKLHGIFGYASLWVFGMLWITHIVRGWNMRWRRWSGSTLAVFLLVLALTGLGIYYIDSRAIREWTIIVHWVLGLIALASFLFHWLSKSAAHPSSHGPYPWPWFRKRHPSDRN